MDSLEFKEFNARAKLSDNNNYVHPFSRYASLNIQLILLAEGTQNIWGNTVQSTWQGWVGFQCPTFLRSG